LSISDNPILLSTEHLVLENPYYTDDFDDYDDNYINYPVSFSVIFENTLISLFRTGKFVCYRLDNMERDLSFEQRLNTKNFKHHWIVDNNLYAQVGQRIYVWLDNDWSRADIELPVRNQPILYEDREFIVFRDCNGEFGGTIYFYDRTSGDTYFTESTCANSVLKKDGKFFVLAHLGHMMGSSEVKIIEDPRLLTKLKKTDINKKSAQALGYSDNSGAHLIHLDMFNVQLFSTFNYEERQFYIAHINDLTFLAEIDGTDIQIVHPLFDSEIYTHDPITRTYGDYILMNLDFYGTALDKEVSVLILHGNQLIKIDWNEDQSR
jgi:hypothetical protein